MYHSCGCVGGGFPRNFVISTFSLLEEMFKAKSFNENLKRTRTVNHFIKRENSREFGSFL